MSSSTRRRPDRRGRAAAALAVVAVAGALGLAGRAGAAPAVDVLAVQPAAGEVTLVAGVTPAPAAALPAEAFGVTDAAGAAVPATVAPVLAGDLATALVLDTSSAGTDALQAGINGAASFLLQLPDGARTLVVTDGGPPTLLAPLTAGASTAIAAVNAVRPGGERQTGAALQVALDGLPAVPGRPRVLLLHTGATDAGGEPAAALAARMRAAGVLLAVVATGQDQRYWAQAAEETGGVLVPARGSGALGAFDRLAGELRGRYAVTVPRPALLPATLRLSVRADAGTASTPVEVRAEAAPLPAAPADRGWWPALLILAAVVVVAAGLAVLLLRRVRTLPRPGRSGSAGVSAGSPQPISAGSSAAGSTRAAGTSERRSRSVALPRPRRPLDSDSPFPPTTDDWPLPGPATNGERPTSAGSRPPHHLPPPSAPLPRRTPGATSPPVQPTIPAAPSAAVPADDPTANRTAANRTTPAPGTARPADDRATDAGASQDDQATAGGGGGGVGADPGVDERAYQRLDAEIGRAAADVARGRLDAAHAVAKMAFAARGRLDLLDRVIDSERRLTGADLGASPSPAAVLTLLTAARRIVAGEVALVGPAGVRVEQCTRVGPDGRPRHILRLTGRDRLVRECRTAGELARHVDLASLTPDSPA